MIRNICLLFVLSISLYGRSYEEIINTKVLNVAMRQNSMTYSLNDGKIVPGFNYALAKEFCKFMGVKLKIVHVKMFRDYWFRNGAIVFKSKSPVLPDIFDKADITIDIISKNKEREKYVSMIPYIENKTILFSNKDSNIKNVKDLIGKQVLLFEGMQSQYLLENILKKENIRFKTFSSKYDEKNKKMLFDKNDKKLDESINFVLINRKEKLPFLYVYLSVYQKDVDASLTDAFSLFQKLYKYEYLKDDLIPSFTLDQKNGYLSATMPKNSKKLQERFRSFVKISEKNGFLNKLMMKHLNIDLKTYKKILEYHEN